MSSPASTLSTAPAGGLLKSAISSASSLVVLQLISRTFTFILNQALFRLASPSAFGAAAIQFELILSTTLFLSREGVRNALLRVRPREDADITIRRMNISFLPIFLGVPLALITSVLYTTYAGQEVKKQPHFQFAIALYALAAITELLSEPMYNVAMNNLKTSIRVRAEGLGITVKSITTFLVLAYDSKVGRGDLALISFAMGQVFYSLTMFVSYLTHFGFAVMRPRWTSATSKSISSHIDSEALRLSMTMTMQSVVKHFLTEGDKMIISWFSPLHDQGGYAIATNYGSLVARIVFQPIEETLRLFFSRLLSTHSKDQKPLTQAANTLHSLLSVQIAFSVILVVFGTAYLPILLPLLIPQQYLSTSAPHVLAAWVWYTPVLALNGGLEAFLSSVATPKDLNTQSRWMVVFSTIYIFSSISFYHLHLGDASLVYANVINLCARIAYCLLFSNKYFKPSPSIRFRWYNSLPSMQLWIMAGLSTILIRVSDRHFSATELALRLGRKTLTNTSVLFHLFIGTSLAVLCLWTWWTTSGRYLNLPLRRKVE